MPKLDRHPIFLNNSTIILITRFENEKDYLDDLWTMDYIDHHKDAKNAARQLVSQIRDSASIIFLQELRAAIAEEIIENNKTWMTNHGIDTHSEINRDYILAQAAAEFDGKPKLEEMDKEEREKYLSRALTESLALDLAIDNRFTYKE